MTRQEVIERFCQLSDEVNKSVFHYDVPSDCFCGHSEFPRSFHYEYSEKILNFIEEAVNKSILEGGRK